MLGVAGSGNFSSVHKARDNRTGQTRAVKVMKSHEKIGMREALLLKTLEHPNIIRLFDFEQDSQQTSMVLEYFPENTLELYELSLIHI